jgi:hypothetical protein
VSINIGVDAAIVNLYDDFLDSGSVGASEDPMWLAWDDTTKSLYCAKIVHMVIQT